MRLFPPLRQPGLMDRQLNSDRLSDVPRLERCARHHRVQRRTCASVVGPAKIILRPSTPGAPLRHQTELERSGLDRIVLRSEMQRGAVCRKGQRARVWPKAFIICAWACFLCDPTPVLVLELSVHRLPYSLNLPAASESRHELHYQ